MQGRVRLRFAACRWFEAAVGAERLDTPPTPMEYVLTAAVICYKPRSSERRVHFKEVGREGVSAWPRFDLDYAAVGSETVRLRFD